MKTLFLCLLLPLQLLAQNGADSAKDITGLWKGTVITPELNLPYELVITRRNGILSGYSHTTFTVRGEEIVSVKKVSVRFKNDKIIVEDEDMLFNNFKEEAPRKIKQTNKLTLDESGKVWKLFGTFEARAAHMLKPAAGTIDLEKKESPVDTRLLAKLGELNLSNTISFSFNTPETKEPLIAAVDKPLPGKPNPTAPIADYGKRVGLPEDSSVLVKKAPVDIPAPPTTDKKIPVAVVEKKENTSILSPSPFVPGITKKPGIVSHQPLIAKKTPNLPTATRTGAKIAPSEPQVALVIAKENIPVVTDKGIAKTTAPIQQTGNKPPTSPSKKPLSSTAVVVSNPAPALPKPPAAAVAKSPAVTKPTPVNIIVAPALDLAKRQIETIQQLYIESDSLQFTLYDNGEIDGDTVSVALNGKTIVSRQGLNTTAFTKTVYITPDLGDSIQLIMYAENLGSLPPNTGLLVLQYDNKRQEIRFSGDLNKNAAITLRRKQKE
jgi:hypothetical protein